MYLAVVVSYNMYLGLEEGDLDKTCKDNKIVEFWTFLYLLSNQMLNTTQSTANIQVASTLDLLDRKTKPQDIIERMIQGGK